MTTPMTTPMTKLSPPVVVRDAVVADVPAVIRLLQQLNLGGEAREGDPDAAVYRDAFAAIDADPRQSLLVVMIGADVVGTATLVIIPNLSHGGRAVAQIESVVVDAGHRGRGGGEALVDECLRRAAVARCFRAQLTSNAARVAAHRFWEQRGFTASHVGFKRSL
jgi:GNAT superfamily N-acetyltransferase